MTKLCNTCEYLKYCARSGIEEVGCDRYKKDMTTNEEWFCNLSTEEKAEFLKKIIKSCGWCLDGGNPPYCLFSGNKCLFNDGDFVEWLKQPHRGEP